MTSKPRYADKHSDDMTLSWHCRRCEACESNDTSKLSLVRCATILAAQLPERRGGAGLGQAPRDERQQQPPPLRT